MTYEEYKKLMREYEMTDSAKRREEIVEDIYAPVTDLLDMLHILYAKNGRSFFSSSDYRTDRGFAGIGMDESSEEHAYIHCYDLWRYGGECDLYKSVPMKYLDKEELEKLDPSLKS